MVGGIVVGALVALPVSELTGGLTFSYGLLETAGLVPHLPLVCIAPFMIAVWGRPLF